MKKYLKQFKINKKGFTLIEMIVVIAVIGILAAVLVPSMGGYLNTAKESRNTVNAKTIYTAAQAAVTSLEIATSVEDGTYTKEGDNKTFTSKSKKNDKNPPANDQKAEDLFKEVESIMGTSNYGKIYKIMVTVVNSTVTEIEITEKEGDNAVTYPQ